MQKILIGIVSAGVVLVAGFYIFTRIPASTIESTTEKKPAQTETTPLMEVKTPVGTGSVSTTAPHKEFTVEGENYDFNPREIRVKKGDVVTIHFKDTDGFHDLRIEGYNVGSERIRANTESGFTFTADKAGTFAYYCSVGSHRAQGMEGKLIVE